METFSKVVMSFVKRKSLSNTKYISIKPNPGYVLTILTLWISYSNVKNDNGMKMAWAFSVYQHLSYIE